MYIKIGKDTTYYRALAGEYHNLAKQHPDIVQRRHRRAGCFAARAGRGLFGEEGFELWAGCRALGSQAYLQRSCTWSSAAAGARDQLLDLVIWLFSFSLQAPSNINPET